MSLFRQLLLLVAITAGFGVGLATLPADEPGSNEQPPADTTVIVQDEVLQTDVAPAINVKPGKPPILPLVAVIQGETSDLLMTSPCDRYTRGMGLQLRVMNGTSYLDAEKTYTHNGVTMKIIETTKKTEHAAIDQLGLRSFVVQCVAAADAKPGVFDMHISDSTCSGVCHADFRVIVLAKLAE